MIRHGAVCVCSADTGARVTAVLIHASQVRWAIGVENTFGTASGGVGIASVWWNARTLCGIVVFSALGVLATRRRVARVFRVFNDVTNLAASNEGIAFIAGLAITESRVCDNMAFGVWSTSVHAWINAFFSNASLVLGTFSAENALGTAVWGLSNKVFNA